MLVPLVWFEESAMINEETADKFRSSYTDRVRRMNTILLTLLAGSAILFAINLHLLAVAGFGRNKYKLRPQSLQSNQQQNQAQVHQINVNSQSDLDTDSSRIVSRRESAVKSPLLDSSKLVEPTRGLLSEKLGNSQFNSTAATTDLLMDLRSQLVSSSRETFGSSSSSSSSTTKSLTHSSSPTITLGQNNATLIDDQFSPAKENSHALDDKSNPPD